MKTTKDKTNFIELRAKGLSLEKISNEINVSKPVLIEWEQEFSKEIANSLYFEIQSLLEQYKLFRKNRIENIAKQLDKINNEIDKKDFTNIPLKDLFGIKNQLELNLRKELKKIKYNTGNQTSMFDVMNDFNEILLKVE